MPPRTTKDLKAPLEVEAAYSTTCEMLKKYYNRVAHRDKDKKKDAGDKGGDDESPLVENAFFIFG